MGADLGQCDSGALRLRDHAGRQGAALAPSVQGQPRQDHGCAHVRHHRLRHGLRREAALPQPAAAQRPLSTQVFNEPSGQPAWKTLPSWAVVGSRDRIIPVADQTAMAKRAGARITRIDAPHLSMATDARTITDVILRAATPR